MVCELGYRSVAPLRLPAPLPKKFRASAKPLEVDQDLLEKIGVDDPKFLEWIEETDFISLLEEALRRTQVTIKGSWALKAYVSREGFLEMESDYRNPDEKKKLDSLSEALANRFQIEILKIVAELLDYKVVISAKSAGSNQTFVLEGEKESSSSVHEYLRVEKMSDGSGKLSFEHFQSSEDLRKEQQKFLALAQKLGVKLTVGNTEESGQPIPAGAQHQDFLKGGGSNE